MKRYLAVLNVGRGMLYPASRDSMVAAAARWGAEFCEIRRPLARAAHPYWQKLLVHRLFRGIARVLQLDADMIISSQCPDPFRFVRLGALGAVSVAQPGCRATSRRRAVALQSWAERIGCSGTLSDCEFLNGGLLLYETPLHRALFERAFAAGRAEGYSGCGYPDQTVLSLVASQLRIPIDWLPALYNQVTRRPPSSRVREPLGYIEHFVGANKGARIGTVNWDVSAARERNGLVARSAT